MKKKAVNQELRKERNDRIKQFLKDMIAPTIFVVVVAIVLYKMATYEKSDEGNAIPDTYKYDQSTEPIVIKDDTSSLVLELDPTTTQFKVYDKNDPEKIWTSNPDLTLETHNISDERDKLQSLFTIQFSDRTGKGVTYDTYSKSVQKQNYKVEKVKDADGYEKIVVHFSLGNIPEDIIVPPVATQEEFEGYLEKIAEVISKSEADDAKGYYDFYNKDALPENEEEREALLTRYPSLEETSLYVMFPNQNTEMLKFIEEDFKEIGYTREDYNRDCLLDKEQSVTDIPIFNVSVEFKLKGGRLYASVPFANIENMEKYPITKIDLLPFFGAGSTQESFFLS